MSGVHQFVPVFEPGAVGAHTLEIRRALRDAGYRSEIYTERIDDRYAQHEGRVIGAHAGQAGPGDVLVYHMAIGSPVADYVARRPEPLVVDHHNLTPAVFLDAWEPGTGAGVAWGRRQLAELAPRCALGLADSAFNARELDEAGYARSAVLPILLDVDALTAQVDPAAREQLQQAKSAGGIDWLFVGRIAPNKCQHDVVKAFAAYRRAYDPHARLHLVGGVESPRYRAVLDRFVHALGLDGAVTVTGALSPGELAARYEQADVFVCLSEHEGFCVPLLEAMHHGLPVVAYAAAAVPETLDGAGLLLEAKEPALVAAAVARVQRDRELCAGLRSAAAGRLAHFSLERSRARLLELIGSVVP